jgi:hypothetical protein
VTGDLCGSKVVFSQLAWNCVSWNSVGKMQRRHRPVGMGRFSKGCPHVSRPQRCAKSRGWGFLEALSGPLLFWVGAQKRPAWGICLIRKLRAYSIRNSKHVPGLNARLTRCQRSTDAALGGVCLQRPSLPKLQIQEFSPRASHGGFFLNLYSTSSCGDVSQTRRPTDVHFCFGKRLTWRTLPTGPEDDCSGPIAGRPSG